MSHEPANTLATRASRRAGQGVTRIGRAAVAVVGVVAVVVVASASASASAAGSTVDVATATFGTVLTDAQGFALYPFPRSRRDELVHRRLRGGVARLDGSVRHDADGGPGVGGTVAAVLQSNGTFQVTYNGSPLYTFAGDTTPGEVTGNNVGGFTWSPGDRRPSDDDHSPDHRDRPPPRRPLHRRRRRRWPAPAQPRRTPPPRRRRALRPSPPPRRRAVPRTDATSSGPTASRAPRRRWRSPVPVRVAVDGDRGCGARGAQRAGAAGSWATRSEWRRRALTRTLRAGEWMLGREPRPAVTSGRGVVDTGA